MNRLLEVAVVAAVPPLLAVAGSDETIGVIAAGLLVVAGVACLCRCADRAPVEDLR